VRLGLGRRLGLGIPGVAGSIAVLYFVLMSMLFSRTYEMMTAALAAKGKAEAVSLAARLPFALATNDTKEVGKILADFDSKDSAGRSVVILDKRLSEVATSGAAAAWISVRDKIRRVTGVSSWPQEKFVITAAPSKNEEDLSG
jgi:hypothetical protein